MVHCLAPTTFGGSTAHDPTIPTTAGPQQHSTRAPRSRPRRRTKAVCYFAQLLQLASTKTLTAHPGLLQPGALSHLPHEGVPPPTPVSSAQHCGRRCLIPIAATRGPRFSTIEFLRRLFRGPAAHHSLRTAPQKHHSCATYIPWLC